MSAVALFLSTLFLAYTNGANDNFKGVATLFGSKTINYQLAIFWATITTFVGSLCSIFWASILLKNFSGQSLVPEAVANSMNFHLAVAVAAGLTIFLATIIGFPISTTHSLVGSLLGAGLIAIGGKINWLVLGEKFFLPLLISPSIAIIFSIICYIFLHLLRKGLRIKKATVLNKQNKKLVPVIQSYSTQAWELAYVSNASGGKQPKNIVNYTGKFLGLEVNYLINFCHFLSTGIVSFARGLNDTPKIVALLLIFPDLSTQWTIFFIGLAIAIGGLLQAKNVAITMSEKISNLNSSQGLAANLATGILVILASLFALPVSTTHVSVGAIFGVGMLFSTANVRVFTNIVYSWLLTLPCAALLSALFYWFITLL